MRDSYAEKCRKLHNIMDEYAKSDVAVAFSGGVDSSASCQGEEKSGDGCHCGYGAPSFGG